MIKKLTLKNFKAFEEETFNIAPLTLITGINGMGKSSIIQSLLLLKDNYNIKNLTTGHPISLTGDLVDFWSCCRKKDMRSSRESIWQSEPCDPTASCGISTPFGVLFPSPRQVPHALLTRPPLGNSIRWTNPPS